MLCALSTTDRSSANDQENAAKVEYLERENETLRKRLQETIATADKVASEAAYKAEIQLAQMDSEVNGLKTDVTKLERKVEGLTKRNKLLEEAAARSTRGLRAGRAVVAVSKRRQSQIREVCLIASLQTTFFLTHSHHTTLPDAN